MPHFFGRTHSTRLRAEPVTPTEEPEDCYIAPVVAPTHEEIAALAHSYWEKGGRRHGSHMEDWFRAEKDLRDNRQK